MVAMAHAARYPAAVSHLVLMVTASHAGFNALARQHVAQHGTLEQVTVCQALWSGQLDTVEKMRHYYEVMGPLYAKKYDAVAAGLTRGRSIFSPEAINRAFAPGGFLQSFDLRPELHRITAPTLVIHGKADPLVPYACGEDTARRIPGARLIGIDGMGHDLPPPVVQSITDALIPFLHEHP